MTAANDRELILERIIDAAPAKLYRAWTEPERLKQWLSRLPGGRNGATARLCSGIMRFGGA